jgi:cardiolipin synthase
MTLPSQLEERIYTEAREYFEGIINAINQANHSVDLEVYIYDNDALSERISQALEDAARRGIKVRLLTDGVGAGSGFSLIADRLINAGAQVRVYHPLPWHFEQWRLSLTQSKGIEKFITLFSFINKRDHRKLLIIDQRIVWLGSFNITHKHLRPEDNGEGWRDTAVEIKGMDLEAVQLAFDTCWFRRTQRKAVHHLPRTPFMFNFTRSLRTRQRKRLLKRIDEASDKIWITNAYFVPDKKLLNALIYASYRKVDVRILLPETSDIFFIPWASSYFYGQLLKAGVRIFEYQHRILHAKTIIIDNWGTIGSSNLNSRSLHHDLELDYSLQLDNSKARLMADFLDDLTHSEELDTLKFEQKRLWQRTLGGILVFFFSRWV